MCALQKEKKRKKLKMHVILYPSGYAMYQVKHSTIVRSAHTVFMCCVNSDLCHSQHKLIGFYNRNEKCLQRGTDCAFK
jgi:hypothetical protein